MKCTHSASRRSLFLAAAAVQLVVCAGGAAQTTRGLPGSLQGWLKLPPGTDLHQLRVAAPGFSSRWRTLSDVVEATDPELQGWHRLEMRGKAPWSGTVSLIMAFDYGGFGMYETHHVWSSPRTTAEPEGDLGLIDLSNVETAH